MAVMTRSSSAKKVVHKAAAVKVTKPSGGGRVSWDDRFDQLVAYKNEHGHANPLKRNGQLGKWCDNQRARFQFLHQYQINKLSKLGFQFCLRNSNKKPKKYLTWDDRFDQLVAYKNEHGHANPLNREGQLGTWCDNQRRLFQDKMKNVRKNRLIHPRQIKKLAAIGFLFKRGKGPQQRANLLVRPVLQAWTDMPALPDMPNFPDMQSLSSLVILPEGEPPVSNVIAV